MRGRGNTASADNISNFDNKQARIKSGLRYKVNSVTDHRSELFYGLIRIHVLLHAAQEPIFGLGMMEELRHHGYRIGPGTLYPLLHGMERAGLLKSASDFAGGRRRRTYRITPAGKRALAKCTIKVDELYHELHEEHPRKLHIAPHRSPE